MTLTTCLSRHCTSTSKRMICYPDGSLLHGQKSHVSLPTNYTRSHLLPPHPYPPHLCSPPTMTLRLLWNVHPRWLQAPRKMSSLRWGLLVSAPKSQLLLILATLAVLLMAQRLHREKRLMAPNKRMAQRKRTKAPMAKWKGAKRQLLLHLGKARQLPKNPMARRPATTRPSSLLNLLSAWTLPPTSPQQQTHPPHLRTPPLPLLLRLQPAPRLYPPVAPRPPRLLHHLLLSGGGS